MVKGTLSSLLSQFGDTSPCKTNNRHMSSQLRLDISYFYVASLLLNIGVVGSNPSSPTTGLQNPTSAPKYYLPSQSHLAPLKKQEFLLPRYDPPRIDVDRGIDGDGRDSAERPFLKQGRCLLICSCGVVNKGNFYFITVKVTSLLFFLPLLLMGNKRCWLPQFLYEQQVSQSLPSFKSSFKASRLPVEEPQQGWQPGFPHEQTARPYALALTCLELQERSCILTYI